jgi:hypothetical protein
MSTPVCANEQCNPVHPKTASFFVVIVLPVVTLCVVALGLNMLLLRLVDSPFLFGNLFFASAFGRLVSRLSTTVALAFHLRE